MIFDYVNNNSGLPFEQQISKNLTSELQWYPNLFVSFLLVGSLSIHYKNQTRSLNTHDIYFFPPFETFSVVTASEDAHIISFLIDYDFIHQMCPEVEKVTLQRSHITCNLTDPIYRSLCKDFATIVFNTVKNELCSRLKQLTGITHLVTTMFETFGTKNNGPINYDYSQNRVIQILTYINDNYMNKFSVDDIASHLGIHPRYFSTFFKKQFHTSFIEYLTAFRVNRSINELLFTNNNILDIAICYGFNNHKTYSTAFRKIYNMSPSEYKKSNLSSNEEMVGGNKSFDIENGLFTFLQQFMQNDTNIQPELHGLQTRQMLSIDIPKLSTKSHKSTQEKFCAVGRAYACLRHEIQLQIKEAKNNFDFDYLRIRDIFSDDLFVYYENDAKESVYSWQSLESVFDFILSLGIKPFPELGFMPNTLASKKQYAGWQYHPNVSFPKSLKKWSDLITNFLIHFIDRYGITEIRSWYFDFWTNPDLVMKNGYWNETQEKFFEFYNVTYQAFQKVDSELRLGTPNFSAISGFPWYEAFFQYCYANHIYPSYVSIHLYGCDTILNKKQVFLHNSENDRQYFSVGDQNLLETHLLSLHQIMNHCGFRSLDVIVSDWNLTFLPKDLVRDTCYMSAYIAHSFIHTNRLIRGLCFWSLSDIHEDFFPESTMFRGGPGLLEYHGFKKASYNTVCLINQLGDTILDIGDNYIFVKKGYQYQLLLYNLVNFDNLYALSDTSGIDYIQRYNIYENQVDLNINISLSLPSDTYLIKRQEVNRKYGSAYDLWVKMGAPTKLNKEIEDYIRQRSVPNVTYSTQIVSNDNLLLDEVIPPHGVLLLEICKNVDRLNINQ